MPSSSSDIDPLEFHYRFKLKEGEVREFTIRLDEQNLTLIQRKKKSYPDWTKLTHHQCSNCPLNESEHPRCPAAVAVSEIVDRFRNTASHVTAEVTITSANRTFHQKGPVSTGLSALLGLHMATSGCPILDKMRPMTRTHLPFASYEETMYRMLSMYMLAQHFQMSRGKEPDWKMTHLAEMLEDIRRVNKAFCERIRDPQSLDSNVNAMVLLDCFAGITEFALKKKDLRLIERTFAAYLNP